jgi:hypothetical protein
VTDAIMAALRREVERRRQFLDAHSADLAEVVIRVRLNAATGVVKGIVWEEERVYRHHERAVTATKEGRDTLRT